MACSMLACIAMRVAIAATCRSCGDGSAGASAADFDPLGFGAGFCRGATGRSVDPDFATDRVLLPIRAGLVGEARATADEAAAGGNVRHLVRTDFAVASLQGQNLPLIGWRELAGGLAGAFFILHGSLAATAAPQRRTAGRILGAGWRGIRARREGTG
jgi:hypothetical protein